MSEPVVPEGPQERAEPTAQAEEKGGRKRPGPFRRWLLRPFVWGGLLFLVAVIAALLFAQSHFARERALTYAKARLEEFLGRKVEIGSVDFDYIPPSIEVRDVVIPGPTAQDPPVLKVERASVLASLRQLRQPIIQIEQIEVVRPQFYLQLNADGTNNLPKFNFGKGGGKARVQWWIGHLLIQEGTIRIDERAAPFGLKAEGVLGRVTGKGDRGGKGGNRLDLLATAQELEIELPDANPYVGTLSVKGSLSTDDRRIDIATVRVAGPDLAVDGSARIDYGGEKVAIDAPFRAEGATTLLNRLGYMKDPILGDFRGEGRFAMADGVWKYSGTAQSDGVEVLGRSIAEIEAGFAGSSGLVEVDIQHARHAGGRVAGTVEVRSQDDGRAGVPVALDLEFADLALETLIADQLAGKTLPVVGQLTGKTTGTFKYAFRSNDPIAGSGGGQVRLAGVSGQGLPLTGSFPIRMERGVVSAQGVELTAPGQTVSGASFSFDLPRQTGKIDLRVTSTNLAPMGALLESTPKPAEPTFWIPSRGRGVADVSIAISPASTTTRVILDLEDVTAPALGADILRGAMTITDQAVEDLRIEASHGVGALQLTGRIPLPPEGKKAAEPLSLAVEASQWPASELDYFLAIFLPPDLVQGIRGDVSGRVDLGGTPDRLTGRLDTEIRDLVLADLALGQVHAAVRFEGDDVAIDEALIRSGAGNVAVRGALRGPGKTLDFTVDAPTLSLSGEPLRALLGGDFGGKVEVAATASGTLDKPQVTASIRARDLTYQGTPVDQGAESHVLAEWDGERASLEGELLGLAKIKGGGRLDRQGAGMAFDVSTERLYEIARIAAPQQVPEFTGSLLGTAAFDADFQDKDYHAVVRLADLKLGYQGRTIRNLEPVVVEAGPRQVKIQSFYLGTPGPDGKAGEDELFVSGTIGLGAEQSPIDLRAQSTISAAWADLFVPNLRVKGALDVLSTVRGTLSAPVLSGFASLREASLVYENRTMPQKLDDLVAEISFNRNQIELETLKGRLGGADLSGGGRLDLPRDGQPLGYRLSVNVRDLSLVYPDGVRNQGNAAIALTSTPTGRRISGVVDLERTLYVDDIKTEVLAILQDALRRQRLEIAETDDFLSSTELGIRIVSDPSQKALRVRNNLADLRGDIDLTIGGTLARPTVLGKIEVEPGGTLTFQDNEYKVERLNLLFNNSPRINPAIDLVARTEVRSFGITVTVDGTLDKPFTSFSSESDLAQLDILSLVATGQEFGDATAQGTPSNEEGAAPGAIASKILAGQAFGAVSKRVGTLIGLDSFRISPISESGQNFSDVGLTVGKRIRRDLFVTYTSNGANNLGQVVQLEYQAGRGLTVVFTATENEKYALDLKWEKRF